MSEGHGPRRGGGPGAVPCPPRERGARLLVCYGSRQREARSAGEGRGPVPRGHRPRFGGSRSDRSPSASLDLISAGGPAGLRGAYFPPCEYGIARFAHLNQLLFRSLFDPLGGQWLRMAIQDPFPPPPIRRMCRVFRGCAREVRVHCDTMVKWTRIVQNGRIGAGSALWRAGAAFGRIESTIPGRSRGTKVRTKPVATR